MRNTCYICLLLFLSQGLWSHAQSGLRPRGDVNCDWEVTIADVNALTDSILVGAQYHSFYSYDTDLNQDQEINIADLNLLIDALLGAELPPMPSYSGTLPVLYINTEGHRDIVSKEEYLHADWWLDAMSIEGYQSIGTAQHPLGMQIKGRGNYTWSDCDKKPFRLKLDEKQAMLGMKSNRHWVLLANAFNWQGQIENTLPYEIGRRMGMAWNPHMEPVEVMLNGQYIGLYFMTEKIRVEKDRVNIIEQKDNETDTTKVTGGWLLEIDNYIEPGNITFTEGNGKPFWVTPHTPEELSDVQRDYITSFLVQADSAIYCNNKIMPEWEKYIDIDSLAIYYIVQEIAHNLEAFSGSCYMHKNRGENTKLIFGPIWDCDHSYYDTKGDVQFDYFIYQNLPSNWYSRWIGEIAKFPNFQLKVRLYWKHFYEDVYPSIDPYLDGFIAKIELAGYYDYIRWTQYDCNNNLRYRLENYGRPFFHKKVAWLQSQWGVDTIEIPESQEPVPDPNSYQQNDDGCSNRNTQESSRGHGAHPRGKQR